MTCCLTKQSMFPVRLKSVWRYSKEKSCSWRIITIPANAAEIYEFPIRRNAKDVNSLLLNRQNSECSTIQVDTLIVWQVDLITSKPTTVCDMTTINADNVKCTVFKWRTRIWTNGLVVTVYIVKQWCCMLFFRNICCWANNYISKNARQFYSQCTTDEPHHLHISQYQQKQAFEKAKYNWSEC